MDIHVSAAPGMSRGRLRFGAREFDCALGRSGIFTQKSEGDGATPTGLFPLRELRYRADRLTKPLSLFTAVEIARDDGWCDAPSDPAYNRFVRLPYPASAENLWRTDHLYDLLVVMGYNDDPVRPGAGSAIFFHLANEKDGLLQPTEGCVALRLADMIEVLAGLSLETRMRVELR